MQTAERELITTTEAADRLHVSHSTMIRAVRNGEIPYVQRLPGSRGAYLLDPDVVEAERQRRLGRQRRIVDALEAS